MRPGFTAVFVAGLGISALSATAVAAQTCAGTASFNAGPVRLGGAGSFTKGAKTFGAGAAFGVPNGVFAGLEVGSVSFDDVDENATAFAGTVGFSVPVGTAKKAEFCPIAGVSRMSGPNIDVGVGTLEVAETDFSFGGSLGGIASSSPSFDFVPFGSAEFVSGKATVKLNGQSDSQSDTYGLLTAGGGFVFNKTITLQPAVAFPVGLEGADPVFSLSLGFNFGSSSASKRRAR